MNDMQPIPHRHNTTQITGSVSTLKAGYACTSMHGATHEGAADGSSSLAFGFAHGVMRCGPSLLLSASNLEAGLMGQCRLRYAVPLGAPCRVSMSLSELCEGSW